MKEYSDELIEKLKQSEGDWENGDVHTHEEVMEEELENND